MSLAAPPVRLGASRVITPFSQDAMGLELNAIDEGLATVAWPTTNQAVYVSFGLTEPLTVKQAYWENGTAVSGNACAAIADDSFVRRVTTGSTAQTGTSALQIVDVTDTVLEPGRYWLCFVLDNNTGALIRANPIAQNLHAIGVFEQASGFPIPDPIVPTTPTMGIVPIFGFTAETAI